MKIVAGLNGAEKLGTCWIKAGKRAACPPES